MRKTVYGHLEVGNGKKIARYPKIQLAGRYPSPLFHRLVTEADKREISVNSLINEAVKQYLGVK